MSHEGFCFIIVVFWFFVLARFSLFLSFLPYLLFCKLIKCSDEPKVLLEWMAFEAMCREICFY